MLKDKEKKPTMASAMQGAWLLTLAGLIAKILSAVYRVPLQNLVGNTGFYVYQQVYPIYGIGMTFALSGLPNFIAKHIALQTESDYEAVLLKRFSIMMSVFALCCFALVYGGADLIAQSMGDLLLAPVIQSVSWMFLLMPVLLIFRGLFQGHQMVKPTALSQVVEQLVRVIVILVAAWQFTLLANGNVYEMGANAMQSAWVAAAFAGVILIIAYVRSPLLKIMQQKSLNVAGEKILPYHIQWRSLWQSFFTEGLIICFFSALLVFFQLVDSLTVYDSLTTAGISDDLAKSLKGVYDRGQPLVQLGLVVANAFQMSYLPLLAKHYLSHDKVTFNVNASQYFRVTLVFATLASAGMIAIMPSLNHFLFGSREGSSVLAIYVMLVVWASIILVVHNILQAQGKWYHSGIAFILGLVIKGLLNHYLVLYFQTVGAALATNIALIIVLAYLLVQLPQNLWHNMGIGRLLKQLIPLIMTMMILIRSFYWLWEGQFGINRMLDSLSLLPTIGIGGLIVIVWLRFNAILSTEEWLDMPLGELVVKYWLPKDR